MYEFNSRALRAPTKLSSENARLYLYAKDMEHPCMEGSYILRIYGQGAYSCTRLQAGVCLQGAYEQEKLLHRILVSIRPLRVQMRKRQWAYTVL